MARRLSARRARRVCYAISAAAGGRRAGIVFAIIPKGSGRREILEGWSALWGGCPGPVAFGPREPLRMMHAGDPPSRT